MKKVIITVLVTVAIIAGILIMMSCGVDAESLIQSNCDQVVKDFKGGISAEFDRK